MRAVHGAMVKPLDLRLNAIVDPERAGGRDLADLARRVAEGGATLVQLRDKKSDTRRMVEVARAIKAVLAPLRSRSSSTIGSMWRSPRRPTASISARMTWRREDARAVLGPDAIIGVSIKSVEAAEAAPVGLDQLCRRRRRLCDALEGAEQARRSARKDCRAIAEALRRRAPNLPIVGIAGIDAGNAGAVIAAGADGVAVISALSLADDPTAAARALRDIVDGMLAKRGT